MRVNVYAEEMTDRIEIISKEIDGQNFTGLRIYLELPATVNGPFIHKPGDDDSSAVTFWGKRDLRQVLHKAIEQLDAHYDRAAIAKIEVEAIEWREIAEKKEAENRHLKAKLEALEKEKIVTVDPVTEKYICIPPSFKVDEVLIECLREIDYMKRPPTFQYGNPEGMTYDRLVAIEQWAGNPRLVSGELVLELARQIRVLKGI